MTVAVCDHHRSTAATAGTCASCGLLTFAWRIDLSCWWQEGNLYERNVPSAASAEVMRSGRHWQFTISTTNYMYVGVGARV